MGRVLRSSSLSSITFCAIAFSPIAVANAELEQIRVGRHSDHTRIVLDVSGAISYRVTRNSESPGFAIELENVTIAKDIVPAAINSPPILNAALMPSDGAVRLEYSLASEAYELRVFGLEPDPTFGRGHRVVVDIVEESYAGIEDSPGDTDPEPTPTSTSMLVVAQADAVVDPEAGAAAVSGQPTSGALATTSKRNRKDISPVSQGQIDFSGTWQHEWAWSLEDEASQKFESFLEPRWDIRFSNDVALTAILRARLDSVGDLGPDADKPDNYSDLSAPWLNGDRAELSLREFYVDFRTGKTDFRVGKQQLVWGQADGFKVLDVLNPQSFREFILDDFDNSRIPLWALNVNMNVADNASLQVVWIPDTTYHEVAELGTPFALTTPRLIPQLPISQLADSEKPDNPFRDSDVGVALSAFVGGWDLSLNYFYRYLDNPLLTVRATQAGQLQLTPEYARSHLLGGTFSNAFGNVTVRGEFGFNTHNYYATNSLANNSVFESPELTGVVGLDWMPMADTLLSVQWFASHMFDYTTLVNRDRNDQLLSGLFQKDFANATWRFRGIVLHSLNDKDNQIQMRLSYWLASSLELIMGVDMFTGNERGLFGQFNQQDRVLFGFEYGF